MSDGLNQSAFLFLKERYLQSALRPGTRLGENNPHVQGTVAAGGQEGLEEAITLGRSGRAEEECPSFKVKSNAVTLVEQQWKKAYPITQSESPSKIW